MEHSTEDNPSPSGCQGTDDSQPSLQPRSPPDGGPQPLSFLCRGIHYLVSVPSYYSWNVSSLRIYSDQGWKKDGSFALGTCNECQQTHFFFLSATRQIAASAQRSLLEHPCGWFKKGDLGHRTKLHHSFTKSVLVSFLQPRCNCPFISFRCCIKWPPFFPLNIPSESQVGVK